MASELGHQSLGFFVWTNSPRNMSELPSWDTCPRPILCLYQDETQNITISSPLCASAFCKAHSPKGCCAAPSPRLKPLDTPEYKLSLNLDSSSVTQSYQSGPFYSSRIRLPFHSHGQERHSKRKLFFYLSSGGWGVGNINRALIIF